GPVAAVAGTCSVSRTIPNPMSWLLTTIISGATGPLTVYRNEVSNPDGENTHTFDVANPLEGLAITTGFAPSEQEDVPTEYAPMAATSRAEFPAWGDPGLELSPVTTISFPVWEGAAA